MNKDANLIAEAYQKVLEESTHCKAAKKGCECDKCDECEDNQTVNEAKKSKKADHDGDGKKDFNDVKIARMVASGMSKEDAIAKVKGKKKTRLEEERELQSAYETILEFKQINKKFARRYNRVTAAMLKAQPGSEEYGVLKSEREDLVTILKDHGQSPKDLEAFLVKKEKENPLPNIQDPQTANQYRDNSYSDTADIPSAENEYEADMHATQSEVSQMPPDAPTPQEVRAVSQVPAA
jgi:hypothetical protein